MVRVFPFKRCSITWRAAKQWVSFSTTSPPVTREAAISAGTGLDRGGNHILQICKINDQVVDSTEPTAGLLGLTRGTTRCRLKRMLKTLKGIWPPINTDGRRLKTKLSVRSERRSSAFIRGHVAFFSNP
jgi:hypothetical protein